MAAMVSNAFISAALYRPLKQCKSVTSCFTRLTTKRKYEKEMLPDITSNQDNHIHSNQTETVTEKDKYIELKEVDDDYLKDENNASTETMEITGKYVDKINSGTPIYKPNKITNGKMSATDEIEQSAGKLSWTMKFRMKLCTLCKNSGFFLLKDIRFSGYCFLSISVNFMLTTAMGFMPALAVDRGISQLDAAFLLSFAGAANMAAVLPVGWIMDLPAIRMRRPYVYTVLTAVIALTMLIIPLMQTFTGFAIVCVIRGSMAGVVTGQKGTITADVLGPERAAQGIGILFLTGSIATLSGRSLAGKESVQYGSGNGPSKIQTLIAQLSRKLF